MARFELWLGEVMPEFLESLTRQLEYLGFGAYWVMALIACLESVIVIGQFVPGGLLLAFVGFLCYLQVFDFQVMLIAVFLGHYAGELVNFTLGRTKGRALFREESRYLKPSLLDAAQRHFHRGGVQIILFSQFTGFFRPLIPFTAGMTHYPLWKFVLTMAFAAFAWSTIHLGIGFVVGASWRRAVGYLEGLSLLILVVVAVSLFSGWLIRKLAQHAGELGGWLEAVSRQVHRSEHYQRLAQRSPRLFGFFEARLSLSRPWGIRASLGFGAVGALMAAFVLILLNVSTSDEWRIFDLSVVNLFSQLRRPGADQVFLFFTYLGSAPVTVLIALVAGAFCLRIGQHKSALVIWGAVLLSLVLSQAIKFTYGRSRPEAVVAAIEALGYSFPSGHATVGIALYGAFYYWLWNHPGRFRLHLLLAFMAVAVALLIGFSRIYLGVHFPSDVLAGFCLGGAMVLLSVTVALNYAGLSERKSRADLPALAMMCLGVAAAALYSVWYPVPPPPHELHVREEKGFETTATLVRHLPREARGLSGRRVVPTNFVWVGEVAALRTALVATGWSLVPPAAFFTSEIQAPLFPLFIRGVPADLTYEKRTEDARMVLRVWRTTLRLDESPAWVGSVLAEKQVPRVLGFPVYQISPDVDAAMERFARRLGKSFCTSFLEGFRERGLYYWSTVFFTHGAALLATPCPDALSRDSNKQGNF